MAMEQPGTGRRGSPLLMGLVSIAVLVLLLFLAIWIFDWFRGDEPPQGAMFGVTVADVVNQPEEYYDESVTVSGEVSEVLGVFAFVIGGQAFFQGAELLVIGPAPPVGEDLVEEDPELAETDIVQVTGRIQPYDPDVINEHLGMEIDHENLQRFEGEHVLIAEATVVSHRMHIGAGELASVDDIVSDPDNYIGEERTVTGEVTDVINESGFVLDGGLLVINATEEITQEALEEAHEIEVSGEIVRFDSAELSEYLNGEANADAFAHYEGEVAMIGRAMLLLSGPEAEADDDVNDDEDEEARD